jgi:hypothetical protein
VVEDFEVCFVLLFSSGFAVYQSLHPLIFSSLQQQQDRGEKLSAVKKCLACLPLLAVVRFPCLNFAARPRRRRRSPFSQGPHLPIRTDGSCWKLAGQTGHFCFAFAPSACPVPLALPSA